MNSLRPEPSGFTDLAFEDGLIKPVQDPAGQMALFASPYVATLAQVEAILCFSPRRRDLFAGLTRYVDAVRALQRPPLMQFISGSFLDNVDEPGDVDVANVVDAVPDEAMSLFYDKAFTRATYGIDPLTIAVGPDRARNYLAVMRLACYYSFRRSDRRQRGFVCLM